MTTLKSPPIKKLLAQLAKAKQGESQVEMTLIGNVLIREQVRFIYEVVLKKPAHEPVNLSALLNELINQPVVEGGSSIKIASKKNLKAVKLWKGKFDLYFKSLKREIPAGTKSMADETLKIAAMLQTTIAKL
ncbi:MAG: hypothetical protein ACXVPQ_00095 [Bacteroidia bacterium]